MVNKRGRLAVVIWLTLSVLFFLTSCQKMKVNYIKANYHFNNANALFTDGQYRRAITEYEEAIKYNPDLIDAYRFAGEAYKNLFRPGDDRPDNMEKAEKALEYLNKAYEFNPHNKEIIFSLGDMYDKLKRFDEAEKFYLKILELEPGNMNNYYVVAEFYKRYAAEKEELRARAESMYLRRIEADPENPQGYAYLANYYEMIQPVPEFDKANEYWDRRISLDPENAEAHYAKGVNRWAKAYRLPTLPLQERLKLSQESLKALLKATELDPNYPEPYAYLSVVYKSVLVKLEPEKESRYNAEADRYSEKFQELRKRQAERKNSKKSSRK